MKRIVGRIYIHITEQIKSFHHSRKNYIASNNVKSKIQDVVACEVQLHAWLHVKCNQKHDNNQRVLNFIIFNQMCVYLKTLSIQFFLSEVKILSKECSIYLISLDSEVLNRSVGYKSNPKSNEVWNSNGRNQMLLSQPALPWLRSEIWFRGRKGNVRGLTLKGFSLLCMFRTCLCKLDDIENDLSQYLHLYGCSPVCVRRWRVKLADLGKAFPQYLHEYLTRNDEDPLETLLRLFSWLRFDANSKPEVNGLTLRWAQGCPTLFE